MGQKDKGGKKQKKKGLTKKEKRSKKQAKKDKKRDEIQIKGAGLFDSGSGVLLKFLTWV